MKKIFLVLGSTSTIILPCVTVLSCTKNKPKEDVSSKDAKTPTQAEKTQKRIEAILNFIPENLTEIKPLVKNVLEKGTSNLKDADLQLLANFLNEKTLTKIEEQGQNVPIQLDFLSILLNGFNLKSQDLDQKIDNWNTFIKSLKVSKKIPQGLSISLGIDKVSFKQIIKTEQEVRNLQDVDAFKAYFSDPSKQDSDYQQTHPVFSSIQMIMSAKFNNWQSDDQVTNKAFSFIKTFDFVNAYTSFIFDNIVDPLKTFKTNLDKLIEIQKKVIKDGDKVFSKEDYDVFNFFYKKANEEDENDSFNNIKNLFSKAKFADKENPTDEEFKSFFSKAHNFKALVNDAQNYFENNSFVSLFLLIGLINPYYAKIFSKGINNFDENDFRAIFRILGNVEPIYKDFIKPLIDKLNPPFSIYLPSIFFLQNSNNQTSSPDKVFAILQKIVDKEDFLCPLLPKFFKSGISQFSDSEYSNLLLFFASLVK